jgi:hypothetical protein
VSALAVFGERIGNDGVQDAQVQVLGPRPGEFHTVATIVDARSSRWLASFEPRKTSAVRLWITRSSGPSPHTDVYETEVYGPPMSPAELKASASAGLDDSIVRWGKVAALAATPGATPEPLSLGIRRAVVRSERTRRELAGRLARWDSLSVADRDSLAAEIERLNHRVKRVLQALGGAVGVWAQRAREPERRPPGGPANRSGRERDCGPRGQHATPGQ